MSIRTKRLKNSLNFIHCVCFFLKKKIVILVLDYLIIIQKNHDTGNCKD